MENVLIVEDNVKILTKISQLLRLNGYNTFLAEDCITALEMAKQFIPDIIISDIIMPNLDEHGLIRELKKDPLTATIPIIFLTANAEYSYIRTGMLEGADDYIVKPFLANDLLKSIAVQLKKNKTFSYQLNSLRNNISIALPHELRTPLVPILGYSQLLSDDLESFTKHEILEIAEKIHTGGLALLKIIEKFLRYAETELIRYDPDYLREIKKSVVTSSKELILTICLKTAERYNRMNNIAFDLVECEINIDESALGMIIEEVAENAFKHSKDNTDVSVKSYLTDFSFFITFENYGPGMTKEQIKNIDAFVQFDRFFNSMSGVGLGLAIVKNLACIYNIKIKIESEKNNKTKVIVEIPNKKRIGYLNEKCKQ